MANEIEFRDLKADEIEVRVAMAKNSGASLLLYKDARCDMRILDETVGPEKWQKRFYEHKGTLFCSVGILLTHWVATKDPETGRIKEFEAPEWVWKDDAGEPSNMSAAKGEASDAFKRACFNWGIGRELYTSPFIWIPSNMCRIEQDGKRIYCRDRFSVAKIRIEDKRITGLAIRNDDSGHLVFKYVEDEK